MLSNADLMAMKEAVLEPTIQEESEECVGGKLSAEANTDGCNKLRYRHRTCGTLHKGRKTDEGMNFLVFGKLKRHQYAQMQTPNERRVGK